MFVDAVSGRLGDNWWKDNLRMSQDTFHILCNELRPYIQKELTNMRSPVTVEERVAVTVWKSHVTSAQKISTTAKVEHVWLWKMLLVG